MGRLDELDLGLELSRKEEARALDRAWERLTQLRLMLGGLTGEQKLGPPVCVVFEGWDASGKGGAIKRLLPSSIHATFASSSSARRAPTRSATISSGDSRPDCPAGGAWPSSTAPGTGGSWPSASRG